MAEPRIEDMPGYGECWTCFEAHGVGVPGKVWCAAFETAAKKTDRLDCYKADPGEFDDFIEFNPQGDKT